ncbi:hypothetical protein FP744_10000070 [Trichoderma asperellum]
MNRGKGRENSRPPRHQNFQNPNRQNEGSKKQWVSAKRMPTAKAQINDMRQVTAAVAAGDYRGKPPAGRDLIEALFVTSPDWDINASEFMADDKRMDGIRKRHQVWIVRDWPTNPSVLKIFSESVTNLQAAINTLNQTFHDERISKDLLTWVIIPQKSSRITEDTRIRLYPNERPRVSRQFTEPNDIPKTAAAILQELRPHIQAATKCLKSATCEIKMRVSFGLLCVERFKKDQANLVNWDEYVALVKDYSRRCGLPFTTRFREYRLANSFITRMLEYDSIGDLRLDHKSTRRTYTLFLTMMHGKELVVENWSNDESALSRAKLGNGYPRPYIDWIVTAPDMMLDWSLHAETWGYESVPNDLLELLKTLRHNIRYNEDENNFLLPSQVVVTKDPRDWKDQIYLTRLKTSFIAEFQDSPYVLEISMTQEWQGLKTRAPEQKVIWQMDFYGKHWDSAMNQVNPVDQRKDFGEGLRNIWVGTDPDILNRFSEFLESFLKVQQQVDFPEEDEVEDE